MEKTVFSGIKEKYDNIDKRIKMCFLSAFICGLFAHIYALTNHLYNYDELWHTPTGFGTGVQMGRWGLSVLAWLTKVFFDDVYTIPVINGLISIACYALLACIVVDLFEINEQYFACIVGAIIVTFPSVVCRMFYMFTTHYYAIGELTAAIGVFILFKCKNKIISIPISFICVIFGTSVYQAVFATITCMILGKLIVLLITEKNTFNQIIKKCTGYFMFLATSMAGYLISNKVALAVTGLQMDKHAENYDTMGQITFEQLTMSLRHCYASFFKAGFRDVYSMNPNIIVRSAFLISVIVIAYICIKIVCCQYDISQKILILLAISVLPVAIFLVYIMAASSGVMYSIMTFDTVFLIVIPLAMLRASENLENCKIPVILIDKVVNYIVAISFAGTVLSYIWFANGNYLAMEYTNQHDNAYYQTLMTQIKSVDGYHADMPITIIGKPVVDSTYTRQDMIGGTFDLAGKGSTNINAYSSWNIMTRVLGYDPVNRNSDEEEEYFRGLDEVVNMPCYPSSGSIKIIDDTIVIKFQEPSELEQ